MQAALYDPSYGYYTNLRGFGADGDFITSPERHPAFGWLLGRQVLDVWEALGRPRPFRILELGGGQRRARRSRCWRSCAQSVADDRLHDRRDEPVAPRGAASPPDRSRVPVGRRATSPRTSSWPTKSPTRCPCTARHHAQRPRCTKFAWPSSSDGGLDVAWSDADAARRPRRVLPAIAALLRARGLLVGHLPGARAVVRRRGGRIGSSAASALILDYTASPPRDSLLTYYRHTLGSDPLVRLGQQDISAHVDLRTLVRLAHRPGPEAPAPSRSADCCSISASQQVQARCRA